MYIRLAFIYINRQSWLEGKEVFIECIKIQDNSPMSWLGLAICNLKLNEYPQAEEALTTANIYDPTNPDIWGWLVYLYLQDNRLNQASIAFQKMQSFPNRNLSLLLHLADQWYINLNYPNSITSLKEIIKYHQKITTIYINIYTFKICKYIINISIIIINYSA